MTVPTTEATALLTLKLAMQILSDNIKHRQGAEQVREGIQRAMPHLQFVHMALATSASADPVADWNNRRTDSLDGWINELLTLREHHELRGIPQFARDAMKPIAHGLARHRSDVFVHEATERDVICKRMRRVARAVGVENEMPENDVLYACIGTVLGTTASALERAALPGANDNARSTLPDAFWEALQRLIENSVTQGPASMEDARLVGRYRDALAMLAARAVDRAVACSEPLPLMQQAFRTTETEGDPDPAKRRYSMIFGFPSLATLQAAEAEWISTAGARIVQQIADPVDPIRLLAPQPTPPRDVVPGKVHCAKCGFTLQRVNLYMQNGATGPGGEETEPCPNDGTPLLPVTWEQEARESWAMAEQQFDRAHALEAAATELIACKDLKDEESRLRQRRDVAIARNSEATAAVDAMRDDYNRRKPMAWAAMRALLAPTHGSRK